MSANLGIDQMSLRRQPNLVDLDELWREFGQSWATPRAAEPGVTNGPHSGAEALRKFAQRCSLRVLGLRVPGPCSTPRCSTKYDSASQGGTHFAEL